MTATHKAEAVLHDCVFTAEFTYVPGAPPSPRTLEDPGGDPGWGSEIEVIRLVDGYGNEIEMDDEENQAVVDWLLETWEPPTGPDPDDERDRRRDEELVSRA